MIAKANSMRSPPQLLVAMQLRGCESLGQITPSRLNKECHWSHRVFIAERRCARPEIILGCAEGYGTARRIAARGLQYVTKKGR